MTVKILVVEPGKKPYEKEIENNLSSFQKEVEGRIEPIYPFEDDSVFCYCNEESKMNGSKLNWGWFIDDRLVDAVCGTFIVLGDNGNGGERSLTENEIEMAKRFFTKNRFVEHKDSFVLVENAYFFE